MVQPRFIERPRLRNPRAARNATQRRTVHKTRARYTGIARIAAVLACVLVLLMAYVVLTSSLTGLSYAVASAQQQREALEEETMRLDDRIAALRSDDRLSAIAARLGMHEAQRFAYVQLPSQREVASKQQRFAVLSSIAGLFMPAVAQQR
jgi:phage shock protein A